MVKRTKTIVVETDYCDIHDHMGDPEKEAQTLGYKIKIDGNDFEGDVCTSCEAFLETVKAFSAAGGPAVVPSTGLAAEAIASPKAVTPVPQPSPPARRPAPAVPPPPAEPEVVVPPAASAAPEVVDPPAAAEKAKERERVEPAVAVELPTQVICTSCIRPVSFDLVALNNHGQVHGKDWKDIQWFYRDAEGMPHAVPQQWLVDGPLVASAPAKKSAPPPASPADVKPKTLPSPDPEDGKPLRGWRNDPKARTCPLCTVNLTEPGRYSHALKQHDISATELEWSFAHPWEKRRRWSCQEEGCKDLVASMHRVQHAKKHGKTVEEVIWKVFDPEDDPNAPKPELVTIKGKQVPKDALDARLLLEQTPVICLEPKCREKGTAFKAGNRSSHAGNVHGKKLEEVRFAYASDPTTQFLGYDESLDIMLADRGVVATDADAERLRYQDRNRLHGAYVRCPYSTCDHAKVKYTARASHAWEVHGISSRTAVSWTPDEGWPENPPKCEVCFELFPTLTALLGHERIYKEDPNLVGTHKPGGVGDLTITVKFDPETGTELPRDYQERMTIKRPGTVAAQEIRRREGVDRLPIEVGTLNHKGENAF